MQIHPYAMAIINDLFDEELDPDLFARSAPDTDPALAGPFEALADGEAPDRRLQ